MESVATSLKPYHVFINHRGKDTKLSVGSLIYQALEPYGLRVFLDQYVLCPGDNIETEIRGAISSSSIHIAIFSKSYAGSRWCLNELCWMLTSSHEPWFIPIFCDVQPSELSFVENGCYAEAFQKHRQRGSMEVDGWKEALGKAAGISGKVFKGKEALGKAADNSDTVFYWKESDDQAKFQRDIAIAVMNHVKWGPLELPPHPVGLDQVWKDLQDQIKKQSSKKVVVIKDLHDQIKKQSSKKVVVIAGLGGIGKSTLARHIFNELSRSEFTRASYLCNVRKTDDRYLQEQLCRDLLGTNIKIFPGPCRPEVKTLLRERLRGFKVLIVFDDVDDSRKIERVLDVHALEEGSLIFVTSRDKDVARVSYKNTSLVYDVQPLKNEPARKLFCYHATRQSNSLEECAGLVEDFLKICGGLPLCLKVLGEQLSSNSDSKHWRQQLELYSQGASLPEADEVINKLKWSCEDMEREQRRMLLDVAYFLVGEDKELAEQVLRGLYTRGGYYLERLCQTYLISFKNDVDYSARENWAYSAREHWAYPAAENWAYSAREDWAYSARKPWLSLSTVLTKRSSKLIMHNEVREMARCIVREDQSEPLRLRCAVDFEKQSGSLSRQVRGICIREDQSPSQLPMDINITGVRLLLVEHSIRDLSTFLGSISGNLVWLRWRVSPFISLPRTISVKNLRVLELQGPHDVHLENFFSSIDEVPLDLRVLHMDCTKHASSSTSQQHSTKSFDGNWFSRFLRSIGTLMQNLTEIVLNNFINSESLPFDFSELKMLRHLDLSGSSNLTTLPDSFSELSQLQHLALRDCTKLSFKADILGKISTLKHIDFKGCAKLERLPDGIVSQRHLGYLNLLKTSLLKLPSNLELLCELEQLMIGSSRFRELPCSVAFLVKLKELFLVGCSVLQHISMPIEQLTCLERLEIYGCGVGILPAGISRLQRLKVLTIISCPIEKITLDNNVIICLPQLTDLTLTHTKISDLSIPDGACPRLEIVDLSHNGHLREVEVSQSTIVKLNLKDCQNLQHMNLPKKHLKFLNINMCRDVGTQNVPECRSLEEITAEECRFTNEPPVWNQLERPAWSQLERLNFFRFSQEYDSFCMRWPKHSESMRWLMHHDKWMAFKLFEKLLNSFDGVTLREVPSTATEESPVVLKKVYSHSAILMCFITEYDKFVVRFEACNGGARTEEFLIYEHGRAYRGERAWVHVYMWTQRCTLFRDEYNFDNVSIYKKSEPGSDGRWCPFGDRGWILTFSTEYRVLDVLNQIINPSAEEEYGLDWLFGE